MRGLTLTQPWASLIALGAKRIETRSWSTRYRGPIAIHAGAGLGPVGGRVGLHTLCEREPFLSALLPQYGHTHGHPVIDTYLLPFGAIVAVATLTVCVPVESVRHIGGDDDGWSTEIAGERWPLTDQECAFGDYSPGRYAWLLADIRPLRPPVPCRGALGLWRVPAEVQAQIGAQL